jgi:hypothetical protein
LGAKCPKKAERNLPIKAPLTVTVAGDGTLAHSDFKGFIAAEQPLVGRRYFFAASVNTHRVK